MTVDELNQGNAIKLQIDRFTEIKSAVLASGTNESFVKYTFPNMIFDSALLNDLGIVINMPSVESLQTQVTDYCNSQITTLQAQLSAL